MATYQLKLKRFELENVNYAALGAFRLRIEVSAAANSGVDQNIFLYQRNLPNPYTGEVQDILLGVASAVDMSEYPVGDPSNATDFPFFRLDYLEIDLRSVTLADKVWQTVKVQIGRLLEVLAKLNNLTMVEEVWLGSNDSGNSVSTSDSLGG